MFIVNSICSPPVLKIKKICNHDRIWTCIHHIHLVLRPYRCNRGALPMSYASDLVALELRHSLTVEQKNVSRYFLSFWNDIERGKRVKLFLSYHIFTNTIIISSTRKTFQEVFSQFSQFLDWYASRQKTKVVSVNFAFSLPFICKYHCGRALEVIKEYHFIFWPNSSI